MHIAFTIDQINHWTIYLWLALTAVWLGFAPLAKRAVYRQPASSRLAHIAPVGLGLYLVFGSLPFTAEIVQLNRAAFTVSFAIAVAGFIVTLCGLAFSIWARIVLDGNWSGPATLKQGHTLVRSGPYRITRHPIYTGLLVGLLGTAIEHGLVRSFLGVLLCALGLFLKIRMEEKLMVQRFGEDYLRYRREVPTLAPFLF